MKTKKELYKSRALEYLYYCNLRIEEDLRSQFDNILRIAKAVRDLSKVKERFVFPETQKDIEESFEHFKNEITLLRDIVESWIKNKPIQSEQIETINEYLCMRHTELVHAATTDIPIRFDQLYPQSFWATNDAVILYIGLAYEALEKDIDASREGRLNKKPTICPECNTFFISTRKNQIYCSKKCGSAVRKRRFQSKGEQDM